MKRLLLFWMIPCAAFAEPAMVAFPDVPCEPGKTVAWTAAMQSAFDRLMGSRAKMKLERVSPENPLITKMRSFSWNESAVLPKDGWVAVAGEVSPKLAQEATEKWRKLAGPDAKAFELPAGAGLAAMVGIKRDFQFRKAFSSAREARLSWNGQEPVKFFGVKGEDADDFSRDVRVLAYRPSEGVEALQFLAKEGDDTMVLYTPKEGQPMNEAIQWVKAWRSSWAAEKGTSLDWDDPFLHRQDDLRVPEIALTVKQDLTANFAGSLRFKGQLIPWVVTVAETDMRLQVDATGVKFESTATMAMQPFSSAPAKPYARRFWFDRPFFLFLWRDGAELPYAAVWFGNADGLVK